MSDLGISALRSKRDELDGLIATARAELAEVNRDIRRALYQASAAAQRLAKLDDKGRPIRNPVPGALSHEDRRDNDGSAA